MKIYIAGKISGDPEYRKKFAAVAEKIRKDWESAIILNPAELPEGLQPKDYMRMCFAMIDAADILYALPDAKDSAGAKLEIAYCEYTGKGTVWWKDLQRGLSSIPSAY